MMKVTLCFALCVCLAYGLPKSARPQAKPASVSSESSESASSGASDSSSQETGNVNVPQVLPVDEAIVQILPFIAAAIQEQQAQAEFSAQVLPLNPDEQDPEDNVVSILPFDTNEGTLGADPALITDEQVMRVFPSLSSIISGAPNGTAALSFTSIFSLLSALG